MANDVIDIPNTLSLSTYMHCGRCIAEIPEGMSPQEYSDLSVGFSTIGLQVWCNRHECNVAHIHFEGQCHPANLTARTDA